MYGLSWEALCENSCGGLPIPWSLIAAIHNTVSDRRGSRRDIFFGYVHKHLPNGARIGRLGLPEQASVYQLLDKPIRHVTVHVAHSLTPAMTVAALALGGGGSGVVLFFGGGVLGSKLCHGRQRWGALWVV